LASEKGQIGAIKALVEAGASVEAQGADADKRTPLDVALDEQSKQTLIDARKFYRRMIDENMTIAPDRKEEL
jgi:hypothetical protein